MGMFDTFHFGDGDWSDAITCHHGHKQENAQTKALSCDMDNYYLVDDLLYVARRRGDDESGHRISKRKGGLVLVYETPLEEVKLTQTVNVYGPCKQCTPVFTRSEHTHFLSNSYLEAHHPWFEVELQFKKGKLVQVLDLDKKNQSRDDLRTQLARGGSALLADDDPMVLEYLEKGK
jgi:hypothetical protein